jgi:predicted RNA binding protein YcfA (HicA-like mRNA interferase family)
MPRLPSVASWEIVRALEKAGFVQDRQKGGHLTLLHPVSRRRVTVSMHGRDLKSGTLHGILKQAGLTIDELLHLLSN